MNGYIEYGWFATRIDIGTETPLETPFLSRISYVGLLLVLLVGSSPFKLPDATNIVPSAMICAEGYHLGLDSLFPGSLQSVPVKLAFVGDLVRYRIPVKPSPTVGSI